MLGLTLSCRGQLCHVGVNSHVGGQLCHVRVNSVVCLFHALGLVDTSNYDLLVETILLLHISSFLTIPHIRCSFTYISLSNTYLMF